MGIAYPVRGMNFIEVIELFERDPQTEGIVMVGEIGGSDEEAAAEHIRRHVRKPVVAYSGRHRTGRQGMGHAGAVVAAARARRPASSVRRAPCTTRDLGSAMRDALQRRAPRASDCRARPGHPRRRPSACGV